MASYLMKNKKQSLYKILHDPDPPSYWHHSLTFAPLLQWYLPYCYSLTLGLYMCYFSVWKPFPQVFSRLVGPLHLDMFLNITISKKPDCSLSNSFLQPMCPFKLCPTLSSLNVYLCSYSLYQHRLMWHIFPESCAMMVQSRFSVSMCSINIIT